MIDYDHLETLSKFDSGNFFATSLYLNVDGSRCSKKDCEILLKDLLKERKAEIEQSEFSIEQRRSLENDFDKIQRFVSLEFEPKGTKGLAVFSCSEKGLWQVYHLPLPVKSRLVVSKNLYTHPLTVLFHEYKRFCVLSMDRSHARIFEVYAGEINEHTQIFDDIPGRVREGGWYGLEGKRIERHIEDHVHRHFKRVAEALLDFFKQKKFAGLVLGGRREILSEFQNYLHSYLKEKIVGQIEAEPAAAVREILLKTQRLEQELKQKEDQKTIKRLLEEAGSGGMAVVGLNETLLPLWRGQVDTLLVQDGFSSPGAICAQCGYLSIVDEICPNCRASLREVADIVAEVVEIAIRQNYRLWRVGASKEFEKAGSIGAFLRFKI